jgi:hypothetical protein
MKLRLKANSCLVTEVDVFHESGGLYVHPAIAAGGIIPGRYSISVKSGYGVIANKFDSVVEATEIVAQLNEEAHKEGLSWAEIVDTKKIPKAQREKLKAILFAAIQRCNDKLLQHLESI